MSPDTTPRFEIVPGRGIGPVLLGMTRTEVRDALASFPMAGLDQASSPTLDYAFGNSLQVEYGASGGVQFIGAGFHAGCGCDHDFRGRHLGRYGAEELFRLLAELDGNPDAAYAPYEHHFPKIRVTVWDADPQYDAFRGETVPVYGQVGVTGPEYDA